MAAFPWHVLGGRTEDGEHMLGGGPTPTKGGLLPGGSGLGHAAHEEEQLLQALGQPGVVHCAHLGEGGGGSAATRRPHVLWRPEGAGSDCRYLYCMECWTKFVAKREAAADGQACHYCRARYPLYMLRAGKGRDPVCFMCSKVDEETWEGLDAAQDRAAGELSRAERRSRLQEHLEHRAPKSGPRPGKKEKKKTASKWKLAGAKISVAKMFAQPKKKKQKKRFERVPGEKHALSTAWTHQMKAFRDEDPVLHALRAETQSLINALTDLDYPGLQDLWKRLWDANEQRGEPATRLLNTTKLERSLVAQRFSPAMGKKTAQPKYSGVPHPGLGAGEGGEGDDLPPHIAEIIDEFRGRVASRLEGEAEADASAFDLDDSIQAAASELDALKALHYPEEFEDDASSLDADDMYRREVLEVAEDLDVESQRIASLLVEDPAVSFGLESEAEVRARKDVPPQDELFVEFVADRKAEVAGFKRANTGSLASEPGAPAESPGRREMEKMRAWATSLPKLDLYCLGESEYVAAEEAAPEVAEEETAAEDKAGSDDSFSDYEADDGLRPEARPGPAEGEEADRALAPEDLAVVRGVVEQLLQAVEEREAEARRAAEEAEDDEEFEAILKVNRAEEEEEERQKREEAAQVAAAKEGGPRAPEGEKAGPRVEEAAPEELEELERQSVSSQSSSQSSQIVETKSGVRLARLRIPSDQDPLQALVDLVDRQLPAPSPGDEGGGEGAEDEEEGPFSSPEKEAGDNRLELHISPTKEVHRPAAVQRKPGLLWEQARHKSKRAAKKKETALLKRVVEATGNGKGLPVLHGVLRHWDTTLDKDPLSFAVFELKHAHNVDVKVELQLSDEHTAPARVQILHAVSERGPFSMPVSRESTSERPIVPSCLSALLSAELFQKRVALDLGPHVRLHKYVRVELRGVISPIAAIHGVAAFTMRGKALQTGAAPTPGGRMGLVPSG